MDFSNFKTTKKLGFGLMRLPQTDPDDYASPIDREKVNRMVDAMMAGGFNYFDTAYVYNDGDSEKAFRDSVVARYPRDSFTITDKLPVFAMNTKADMERIMGERKVPRGGAEETEFISWSHARRNASGRVYSVHAWGYPVLAWPFAKVFGFDAGVSLLGLLLGALGATGVWASSRRCGASRPASCWAAGALCLAWFWAYTALSRLPEMLGIMRGGLLL